MPVYNASSSTAHGPNDHQRKSASVSESARRYDCGKLFDDRCGEIGVSIATAR